jgi:hypothetical protein
LCRVTQQGEKLNMTRVAPSNLTFLELFLESLDEQTGTPSDAGASGRTDMATMPTATAAAALPQRSSWLPDAAALASVTHQNLSHMPRSGAAAAQVHMAKLMKSQEPVQFYFGRGIVLEQMWIA